MTLREVGQVTRGTLIGPNENEKQKHKRNELISHVRTVSLLPSSTPCPPCYNTPKQNARTNNAS